MSLGLTWKVHSYRSQSFSAGDRDVGLIEKKKVSAMIHLPEDWEKVIKEACPSKPFHIQRMEKEDFLDFTPL